MYVCKYFIKGGRLCTLGESHEALKKRIKVGKSEGYGNTEIRDTGYTRK